MFQMKNIFCRNYTSSHHRLKCYMNLGKILTPTVSGYQDAGTGSFTLMGCCSAASLVLFVSSQAVKAPLLSYMDNCDVTVLGSAHLGIFLISCVLCSYKAKSPLSYQENMYLIFLCTPHFLLYSCINV